MGDVLENNAFFTAAFGADGELIGVLQRGLSNLSPRWLQFCRGLLAQGGEAFRTALPEPLDRLEVKFTAASGAAIATFSVSGQLAASAAYLRGDDSGAERELLGLFVESLRRSAVVRQCQASPEPFQSVFGLSQRPLHVVVPWGNPQVAEQDDDLVSELGNHLAAVFLCES